MIDLASFGVREAVLSAIVLITLYLAFTLFRLFFVGSSAKPINTLDDGQANVADEAIELDDELTAVWPSAVSEAPLVAEAVPAMRGVDQILAEAASAKPSRFQAVRKLFKRTPKTEERKEPDLPEIDREPKVHAEAEPVTSAAYAVSAPVIDFQRELARSNLEVEVKRLKDESQTLREELTRLSEEVVRLKASRSVSPIYNEAMSLAQHGMEAVSIADRCGISMSEAELVAALAKGQESNVEHLPNSSMNDQTHGEKRDELYTERGQRRHG